jgi:hypothetical protein
MKNLVKALFLGVVVAASTTLAHASLLAGSLDIDAGTNGVMSTPPLPFSPSTTQISFSGATVVLSQSGSLAGVTSATMASTFTLPTQGVGAPSGTNYGTLFTLADAGTVSFDVTEVLYNPTTESFTFYGYLTGGVAGTGDTNANYVITPNGSAAAGFAGDYSSILTVTPTPEPNSLILLGTGLISAAGVVVRKRRAIV